MLNKEGSIKIFWVLAMSWYGIEPRSPGPLANTLTIMPMPGYLLLSTNPLLFLIRILITVMLNTDLKIKNYILEFMMQMLRMCLRSFHSPKIYWLRFGKIGTALIKNKWAKSVSARSELVIKTRRGWIEYCKH